MIQSKNKRISKKGIAIDFDNENTFCLGIYNILQTYYVFCTLSAVILNIMT